MSKGILNVPQQLISQLQGNMPSIMQALSYANGGKRKIIDINFINPYDNKQNTVTITCSLKRTPFLKASIIDKENKQTWELQIIVPSPQTKQGDFSQDDVLSAIVHEFSHAIDPKSQMEKFDPSYNQMEGESKKQTYTADPKEIDAFQTTFTKSIVSDVASGKININDVLTWLKGNYEQPIDAPSLSYADQTIYLYWFKNNPQAIKLLKQRIYTSLQQNQNRFTKQ